MRAKIVLLISLSVALMSHGASAFSPSSESPLLNASAEGDIKTLQGLLKAKSNLNEKDKTGHTALMIAASNGRKEVVKILLENKVDINIKDDEGQSALYYALIGEQPSIALSLVEQGASLDDISGDGESALLVATTANANDVMSLVIKKKPSLVNKASNFGTTPLMEAARFGSAKTVRLLLKAGANQKLKNQNGKTALDIATKAQNDAVVKLLKK